MEKLTAWPIQLFMEEKTKRLFRATCALQGKKIRDAAKEAMLVWLDKQQERQPQKKTAD